MSTKAKLDLTGKKAAEITDLIAAKAITKAAAVKFLRDRIDIALAKGRIPREPTAKLWEKLSGKAREWDRGDLRTAKQIAKDEPTINEREAAKPTKAKKAKPAKKAKAKAKKANKPTKADALAAQVAALTPADQLAFFTSLKASS